MPLAFIQDQPKWKAAKAKAESEGKADDYEAITRHYTRMGGRVGKKEAQGASGNPQLMRCSRPAWAGGKNIFEALQVAGVDEAKRTVQVIIISEGPGNMRDKNYYTAEAITDGVSKFDGAKCMINHQNREERALRPEQDVWHQAGYYRNTRLVKVQNEQGREVSAIQGDLVFDESDAGRAGLAKAKASILYAQQFPNSLEVYAGISINAAGIIGDEPIVIEGEDWNPVIGFEQVMSADVVTRPARGGKFQKLLESVAYAEAEFSQSGESKMDKKKLIKSLTEAKADLKDAKDAKDKKAIALAEAKVQEKSQALAELTLMEAEEAETDPEDEPKADDDTEEAEAALAFKKAIGKLAPKNADESENEYEARCSAIRAAMSPKKEAKGKESKESLSLADLKAALESAREKKPKELTESVKALLVENRKLKLEKAAKAMLAESELPEGMLTEADLLEAGSVEGMASMIARHERLVEKFSPGGNPQRGTGGGSRKTGLTRESLEDSGLPLKAEVA